MPLHFLLDEPAASAAGNELVLTGAEAHHAATVRRVRVGEEVTVGDGRGTWWTGRCTSVAPGAVVVQVTSRRDIPAASPRIVLAQALAKGDRDELAIQAATELGVDKIVPWQASRRVNTPAVAHRAAASTVGVLDPAATVRLADAVAPGVRDVVLVVGPEGGIAPEEFSVFEAAGAVRAVLGDAVLRTSTAGPAAIAVASLALGRW